MVTIPIKAALLHVISLLALVSRKAERVITTNPQRYSCLFCKLLLIGLGVNIHVSSLFYPAKTVLLDDVTVVDYAAWSNRPTSVFFYAQRHVHPPIA